jgi:hypothetical protein
MKRWFIGAGLAALTFLGAAPVAHADSQADVDAYLSYFSGDALAWIYGPPALVKEGYKACHELENGRSTADTITMIQADMSVPQGSATKMVTAVRGGLRCLS